jgi:hypothetical protein
MVRRRRHRCCGGSSTSGRAPCFAREQPYLSCRHCGLPCMGPGCLATTPGSRGSVLRVVLVVAGVPCFAGVWYVCTSGKAVCESVCFAR